MMTATPRYMLCAWIHHITFWTLKANQTFILYSSDLAASFIQSTCTLLVTWTLHNDHSANAEC